MQIAKLLCAALAASVIVPLSAASADAGGCRCYKSTRAYAVRSYAPRVRYHRPPPVFDGKGHETNWMQRQGFRSCSQVYRSCHRGAGKPGHGLAYAGVCEDRYRLCLRTGSWHTTHTGSVYNLARY